MIFLFIFKIFVVLHFSLLYTYFYIIIIFFYFLGRGNFFLINFENFLFLLKIKKYNVNISTFKNSTLAYYSYQINFIFYFFVDFFFLILCGCLDFIIFFNFFFFENLIKKNLYHNVHHHYHRYHLDNMVTIGTAVSQNR